MINYFTYILFILFSIYIFVQVLAYAIYEIKEINNKFGGIFIIVFAIITIILANIAVFMA